MMLGLGDDATPNAVISRGPSSLDEQRLIDWANNHPVDQAWLRAHPEVRRVLNDAALRWMSNHPGDATLSGLAASVQGGPSSVDIARLQAWMAAHPDAAARLNRHPLVRHILKNAAIRHMNRGGVAVPGVSGLMGNANVYDPQDPSTYAGSNMDPSTWTDYTTNATPPETLAPISTPTPTAQTPSWLLLALVGVGIFALTAMAKK